MKTEGSGNPGKDGKMECERMPSRSAMLFMSGTSVQARFPPTRLRAETRMHMGCPA